MKLINGFINFNGQCREAMTFYQEIFGGDLILSPIEGSPIENLCGPEMKDQIMHSQLTNGNAVIMGTDMTGPGDYVKGNSVGLLINCSNEGEAHSIYEKLSAGGTIIDPIKIQFWGDLFGVFNDKFGINWMVIYSNNQN
ncbi:MAG TPA: VOC family protein [Mucilaginibacter sp.]|nr:VOC family protein [Mucilaginibacter sp.]